jgi:hypothetical protein
MRILAETAAEADLLSRRLQAIQHVLGPDVPVSTNLLTGHDPADPLAELRELLAPARAAADLEQLLKM